MALFGSVKKAVKAAQSAIPGGKQVVRSVEIPPDCIAVCNTTYIQDKLAKLTDATIQLKILKDNRKNAHGYLMQGPDKTSFGTWGRYQIEKAGYKTGDTVTAYVSRPSNGEIKLYIPPAS